MKRFAFAAVLAASPAFADQPVTINFAAEVAGTPFACGTTYSGVGSTDAQMQINDFRMFVHDAALIGADGTRTPIALEQDGKWQKDTVVLLDFEDGSAGCTNGNVDTNVTLRGTVPDGDYTGLSFKVGVPFDANHQDPTLAASPLNNTAMFWNWRAGYKFLRIDMVPVNRAEDGPKGWFLHLGSTMCESASKTEAPASCAHGNRMMVEFDTFDMNAQTVVIDPAPVVAEADMMTNMPDTAVGCMSFPNDTDCSTVMPKLGLDYGDQSAGDQTLISLR